MDEASYRNATYVMPRPNAIGMKAGEQDFCQYLWISTDSQRYIAPFLQPFHTFPYTSRTTRLSIGATPMDDPTWKLRELQTR